MNQPDYIIKDTDVEVVTPEDVEPFIVLSVECEINPLSLPIVATLFPELVASGDQAKMSLSPIGAHDLAQKLLAAVEMLSQQK